MALSPKMRLAEQPPEARAAWLQAQPAWVLDDIEADEWWWTARPEQHPPPGDWFVWLVMSGRGFGKTRLGAEALVDWALRWPRDRAGKPTEWLVIGETISDVRKFCVEGPSGLLHVLDRRRVPYEYVKSPKPTIELVADGQMFHCDGCSDEDTGRGHNAAGAWLDEAAKMVYGQGAWINGIMPSLRADLPGTRPRVIVTTTPKPVPLIRGWHTRWKAGDTAIAVTAGTTFDNVDNLSATAVAEMRKEYAGTSVGRQELHGELLEDADGALWTSQLIHNTRVPKDRSLLPEMRQIAIGVDPAGTGTGDETGIVAVGRGVDDMWYVLADRSKRLVGRPAARRAWALFLELDATVLVVEDNFGKQWLSTVMRDAYAEMRKEGLFPKSGLIPLKLVHALHGKRLRAEPTAMRYEQERVAHVGFFPALEQQMVSWDPASDKDSPDRIDALVHACDWLRERERGKVSIALPSDVLGGGPQQAGQGLARSGTGAWM